MYYVIELQQTTGQAPIVGVYTFTDKNEALSKYHHVLFFAAISKVTIHTALVINELGTTIIKETFTHADPEVVEEATDETA